MARDPSRRSAVEPESASAGRLATQESPDPISLETSGPLRVLVTGGGGFMGRHLVPRLLSRGHRVRAMRRTDAGGTEAWHADVEWRVADVSERRTLDGIARDCDLVVHLAGRFDGQGGVGLGRIHGTGTRNLLWEARRAQVGRFVLVSALGASPAAGEFFRTKFEAEDAVLASGLDWVVLRPSVVYGPGDHFTSAVVRLLRTLPVFPMLGDGTFPIQPLAVEDMTDALTQAVERPDLLGRCLEVAGPDRLSFVRAVRILGRTIGRERPIVPLPQWLARPATRVAARLGLPTPFSCEQLDILRWGSVLESEENPLRSVFRLKPLPFEDAVADYLEAA